MAYPIGEKEDFLTLSYRALIKQSSLACKLLLWKDIALLGSLIIFTTSK
jgi:hypothetical protein